MGQQQQKAQQSLSRKPLGCPTSPSETESSSSPRRPGALGEPERRSQERQEQQHGPKLSPGMTKELKCPEADTAGHCLSGSDLTVMDFVRQDLPLAFRAFCSTSDIHIVCGCQRKALVRGQNEEDVKIFPGPNPSCRAQTAVLNKSDNRSGYGRGPYLRRAGFCLTSPWPGALCYATALIR